MSSPLWDLFLMPFFYVSSSLLKLWHIFLRIFKGDLMLTYGLQSLSRMALNLDST